MNRKELINLITRKKSLLCVGLDSDISKLPECVLNADDPIFEFNRQIIDATLPFTVAYKPNLAFYEANGIKGMVSLQKTMAYLKTKQSECFTIADAKRGDIGNTSEQYAKAFLASEGDFDFDALTIAPYMGEDSVKPFTIYEGKWVILLALTSNKGANDFQFIENNGKKLFEEVILKSQQWANEENMMYVCGATQATMFKDIRCLAPKHFLLVPGVGAQGGSLEEVCDNGLIEEDYGLLINSSRGIIFADKTPDFAKIAAEKAEEMYRQTEKYF